MKTIITMILMISVSLSQGVVYMDIGFAPQAEVEVSVADMSISDSEDLETGSLSIGYYQPIYQISDNMGLFIGGSYEVMPATDEDDTEYGFMALYSSVGYFLSDQLSAWGSLGLSIPTSSDLTDADAEMGMHMGMGVTYSATDKIGVALGYVVNSTSVDMGDGLSADWDFSKIALSLGYRL